MIYALIAVVVGLVAFNAGWLHAHRVVAKECERLGGFYVGKKVFKCVGVEAGAKAPKPLPSGQVPAFRPEGPPPSPGTKP